MRAFGAAILAAALVVSGTLANAADIGPLAPGKAAGVKKAQDVDDATLLWIAGGGLIVAGIAVVASQESSKPGATSSVPTTTTTTTTTTSAATTTTTGTSP